MIALPQELKREWSNQEGEDKLTLTLCTKLLKTDWNPREGAQTSEVLPPDAPPLRRILAASLAAFTLEADDKLACDDPPGGSIGDVLLDDGVLPFCVRSLDKVEVAVSDTNGERI